MKMKPEHFERLKTAIEKILEENPGLVTDYENGFFPRADRVKDLNMRFRWDLFYRAENIFRRLNTIGGFQNNDLWTYLNNTHIDTALRRIVPTIERKY